MDKNVLDKEETHMTIKCKKTQEEYDVFKNLNVGDVFKLYHNKYDTYTYMKINTMFINYDSKIRLLDDNDYSNVVRLDDGIGFFFHDETRVEKYNATLTIEKKG